MNEHYKNQKKSEGQGEERCQEAVQNVSISPCSRLLFLLSEDTSSSSMPAAASVRFPRGACGCYGIPPPKRAAAAANQNNEGKTKQTKANKQEPFVLGWSGSEAARSSSPLRSLKNREGMNEQKEEEGQGKKEESSP